MLIGSIKPKHLCFYLQCTKIVSKLSSSNQIAWQLVQPFIQLETVWGNRTIAIVKKRKTLIVVHCRPTFISLKNWNINRNVKWNAFIFPQKKLRNSLTRYVSKPWLDQGWRRGRKKNEPRSSCYARLQERDDRSPPGIYFLLGGSSSHFGDRR